MITIDVYSSESRATWFWRIVINKGSGVSRIASSEGGDGKFVGFEFRETALADACRVAMEMFPVKAD